MSSFVAHRVNTGDRQEDQNLWLEITAATSLEAAMEACDDDARRMDRRVRNWRPCPTMHGTHRSRPDGGILWQIRRRT